MQSIIMNDPTLALAKQLIALQSVTPNDAGCQILLSNRLEELGFDIEALNFLTITARSIIYGLEKVLNHRVLYLPGILMLCRLGIRENGTAHPSPPLNATNDYMVAVPLT